MNRSGLGRGLSALLPGSEGTDARPIAQIPLAEIQPNPFQPRTEFNPEALAELAASIREHGIMQPVTVRPSPTGDGYQLVAGERRWRAAGLAGLETVPALVRSCTERQMLEMALVENLQREDINALEAAIAYRRGIEEFGLTQEELAQRVGKSRVAVANTLRLLKLSEPVQAMIGDGRLSEGHGRALLALVDEPEQLAVARRILNEGLSVREAERLARDRREHQPSARSAEPTLPRDVPVEPVDPDLRAVAERLQRALGTRVDLRVAPDGRGTITITYYGPEDLDRLLELLDR